MLFTCFILKFSSLFALLSFSDAFIIHFLSFLALWGLLGRSGGRSGSSWGVLGASWGALFHSFFAFWGGASSWDAPWEPLFSVFLRFYLGKTIDSETCTIMEREARKAGRAGRTASSARAGRAGRTTRAR